MNGTLCYLKLKFKMKEIGLYPYDYAAPHFGLSKHQLVQRMCGNTDWTSKEMYQVLRAIKEPVEMMTEYFPEDGVESKKPPVTADGKCDTVAK